MTRWLRPALPLACVVALAAALRLDALRFGLPYLQARPDEITAVGHADAILRGDLNPHFFNWPSLALYTFAAVFGLARSVGVALTVARQILLARAVVAMSGTLTVLATAAIGRRLAGRDVGLVAALFLAVAALHVRDSHFATTDVLMTLLVTVSLALAMRARETGRQSLFAAAGAAGGLAASTKYSAGAILAVTAAAPTIAAAGVFVCAWAAGFLAGTPFALLDVTTFLGDVSYERAHLDSGHAVLLGRGWIYHLVTTLPHGLGVVLCLAAAAGIPVIAMRQRRAALVPALFALAFYATIGTGRTVFFRYALPLVPLACVSAAVAVRAAAGWVSARTRVSPSAIAAALTVAIAAPSLYQSMQLDRILAREDSRVVAAAWLAPRLRADQRVHDSGGDYTRLELGAAAFHDWRYDPAARSFGDPAGATPDWIILYESPLPEYTAAPAPLLELVRDRYTLANRVDGIPASPAGHVYDRQDAFFLPIDGFTGIARPGPTVLIYQRLK